MTKTRARPTRTTTSAQPRVGLFVEGVNALTSTGRDDLAELWKHQCARHGIADDRVDVHGFTKQQLVLMVPQRGLSVPTKIPLDVLIAIEHGKRQFDVLLVIFDALPPNQSVVVLEGAGEPPCMRLEKDFVLEKLAASEVLPVKFRQAAGRLLAHYQKNRGNPRRTARPPICDVETIYMDPMFEALVLQDAGALRDVFSYKKVPKDWPGLPFCGDRPDSALRSIVNQHHLSGPRRLRTKYDARKHAWALEVLRHANANSRIWSHPISVRLEKVLAGL